MGTSKKLVKKVKKKVVRNNKTVSSNKNVKKKSKSKPLTKTKKPGIDIEDALIQELAKEFENVKNINLDGDMELKRQVEELKAGHESTKILCSKIISEFGNLKKQVIHCGLDNKSSEGGSFDLIKNELKEAEEKIKKLSMELRFDFEFMKKSTKDIASKDEIKTLKNTTKEAFKNVESKFISKNEFEKSDRKNEKMFEMLNKRIDEIEEMVYDCIGVQEDLDLKMKKNDEKTQIMLELLENLAKKVVM